MLAIENLGLSRSSALDGGEKSRVVFAGLLVAGIAMMVSIVPGVFTIDEDHYLVSVLSFRHGGLAVPATGGLTPSRELIWFDPAAPYRVISSTPVAPSAPPLYGLVALPFSFLRWHGLVLLNVLSFLVVAWLVYRLVRQLADDEDAAIVAGCAFVFGGYSIEYAQGIWPQMLSSALSLGAFALAVRVRDGAKWPAAFGSGLLAGLATGVRYQGILFAACVGAGIWLLSQRRWRSSALFGLGVALPLALSSWMNSVRLDSWNPISKGPRYFPELVGGESHFLWDAARMAWARIVDYSTRPSPGTGELVYLNRDPSTGAWMIGDTVKKAWLQSSPWIALVLLVCIACWLPLRHETEDRRAKRELRAISLIVLPILTFFSLTGTERTSGLGFNQRYFLELVPLAAVALGLVLPPAPRRSGIFLLGGMATALLGEALLVLPFHRSIRAAIVLYVPLAIAVGGAATWILSRRRKSWTRTVAVTAVGIAVGWALVVHLHEDLWASRSLRKIHLALTQTYDQLLPKPPEKSALVVWYGLKDSIGPLLFDRDLVAVETRLDDGADAPVLIDELSAQGRRVFLLASDMPGEQVASLLRSRAARPISLRGLHFFELGPRRSVP